MNLSPFIQVDLAFWRSYTKCRRYGYSLNGIGILYKHGYFSQMIVAGRQVSRKSRLYQTYSSYQTAQQQRWQSRGIHHSNGTRRS